MSLLRNKVVLFLLVALASIGVSTLVDRLRGPSASEIANGIRVEMEGVRRRIDACLATRAAIELRFQDHARRTSELRAQVDSLEGLDPRGVPADVYDEYLLLVEEFNAAVEEWDSRSEELRAFDPRCRAFIEEYNAMGDSIRRLLSGESGFETYRIPGGDGPEEEEEERLGG